MHRRQMEQAPQLVWDKPVILMPDIHQAYLDEHLRRRGSNVNRPKKSLQNISAFFGTPCDPMKLEIGDWERYEDHRYAQGVQAPTVRREITAHQAAMGHARKRRRIPYVPYVEKPSGAVLKPRRAATEEEYALLMRKGVMTWRTRMLFRLAYWTGHRAKALEQVTFDRIDWVNGTINFNVPGMRITTKRRNSAFPIQPQLRVYLLAAKARHDALGLKDDYVIGLSKRGKVACTWKDCKAAWRSVGVNVEGLARHTFRKTFVVERVKRGKPLPIVAKLIADRAETTGEHYAIFNTADMLDAAAG